MRSLRSLDSMTAVAVKPPSDPKLRTVQPKLVARSNAHYVCTLRTGAGIRGDFTGTLRIMRRTGA